MTRKDKKELEMMLNGFESVLEEFDNTTDPNQIEDLIKKIAKMDKGLSAFEMIEA
jgi:hypothetical protein